MYQQWNKEIKKRMVEHFKGIKDKINDVLKKTKIAMKLDFKEMIKKL